MNHIATAALGHGADRYLALEGVRLRFRDEGAGDVVVLIHGWTLDLEMWEPQAAALSASYRVIRFDRRGFGLSSGHPSLTNDVGDLQALLTHLQIERAALVGMSQGARVALQMAAAVPSRVACLILDGPPLTAPSDVTDADDHLPLDEYRRLVLTSGMEAFRRLWATHPCVRLRTDDARIRELLKQIIARYPGHDLSVSVTASPIVADAPPGMPSAPVLVVNGAFDTAQRRRTGAALCRMLPGAEYVVVPDAGHLPNLDNPRIYNATLREFLRRHLQTRG